MVVVLETRGKRENCDNVSVLLFSTPSLAQEYCRENSTTKNEKYWKVARIVPQGAELEIHRPIGNDGEYAEY